MEQASDNPLARADAPPRRMDRIPVNGTTLHVETRGDGPAVLLIPGGAEDAEGWRAVAERIDGHTVVTYDRRGTLRSGRDDWPGNGAGQHADDAAALLEALGIGDAVVFGASSGGVIAVELALRHSGCARRVLAYEPGYLTAVAEGRELQASARETIDDYLDVHAGDWAGAYVVFAEATAPDPASAPNAFVAPPGEHAWYAERERGNAEAFVRDDLPLITMQAVDEPAIAASPVELRFARGAHAGPLFRDITSRLASIRGGEPDVIDGAGHALYLQPDAAAAYIMERATP